MRTDKISSKWNNQNWKHVTAFDYIDKILIVLSVTSSVVCIISSASIFEKPAGIASAGLTLIFSLTTRIVKKLLSITRSRKAW